MKVKRIMSILLSLLLILGMAAGEVSQVQAAGKPGKAVITGVEKSGKNVITYWNGLGCRGYQYQLSDKKGFPANKTYSMTTDVENTGLSEYYYEMHINGSASYIYIRVRGYNKNGSKKVYGAWSAKKKVKWNGKSSSGSKKKNNTKKKNTAKSTGKAPKLSKKSVTLKQGQSATIKIKNVNASQIKSISFKKKPQKTFEGEASVKKLSKTKFKVTAKSESGAVTVTAIVKLKKPIKDKKTYKLKLNVECLSESGEAG